jgi:hypothetical protein
LIQQLGDESEKVRDTAGKELLKIGEPARQALIDAQNNPIPEIRDRAAILLSSLDSNKIDATPAGLFTTQEAIISSSKNITDEDNSLVIETEKKVVKIHLYHRLSGSVSVYFKDPDVRSNNIALNFDDWRNVKKTNPPVGRMLEEYISEYLPMD